MAFAQMPNELLGMYLKCYMQPARRNGFSMCEKGDRPAARREVATFGRNSIVNSRVTGKKSTRAFVPLD